MTSSATAPSVATFRARFPEFTDALYSDTLVGHAITDSERLYRFNDEARLYCMAHLLVLTKEQGLSPDGGSGVVASERIGARAVTYVQDDKDGFYARSSYGRMFLALEARNPTRVMGFHFAE